MPIWSIAAFLAAFFFPFIVSANRAIWQSKVAPDVQGRVFSARTLIAWLTNPISPLIAGTLADYVLEPAMRAPSGLSALFGGLVPPGPGAGMGLLIFFSCLGGVLAGLIGYSVYPIRHAEDILPDHDHMVPVEAA